VIKLDDQAQAILYNVWSCKFSF